MLAAFAVTFRETLEAALIVDIMLAMVKRFQKKAFLKSIWLGTSSAIFASLLLAAVFSVFFGGFEGKTERIFEGILMILAAGVLSYMILWMQFKRAVFEGKVKKATMEDRPFYLGRLLLLQWSEKVWKPCCFFLQSIRQPKLYPQELVEYLV